MIILKHGAFDSKDMLNAGISVLADEIRELGVDQVFEYNHDQDIPDFLGHRDDALNVLIGYSNGADDVEHFMKAHPYFNAHTIYIDGVHRGGGFMAPDWEVLPNELSLREFLRTLDVELPPWHQIISRVDPPQFLMIRIEANHSTISSSSEVHQTIIQWIQNLYPVRSA